MAKSRTISPARTAAFEILLKIEDGAFSSVLLAAKEPELSSADRALCHELVMGVLRWQLRLDKVIEKFAKRRVESLDLAVLVALRLGIYQLRFLTRVPASAAVNESVNLVGQARLSSAKAFVNAVLRRATREPEYDPAANLEDDVQRLAIQTSHPEWLIARWINAFGIEVTRALAQANNELPPTAIRVVQTRAEDAAVLNRLRDAGATVESSQLTPNAWRVSGAVSVLREMAAAGQIYVQDEASQLVALNVLAQPADRVLDLCAAPGGKTTQIANVAGDALIVAADLSLSRLEVVKANVVNQQINRLSLVNVDATHPLPFSESAFDRVLVDAPCSGTGTLRRNPEIRWRVTPGDIDRLAQQQNRILKNAARVLKPGGRLIYSTCSVEVEENESVVDEFLSTNADFNPAQVTSLMGSAESLRTWPHKEGADGFFIAAFRKSTT